MSLKFLKSWFDCSQGLIFIYYINIISSSNTSSRKNFGDNEEGLKGRLLTTLLLVQGIALQVLWFCLWYKEIVHCF